MDVKVITPSDEMWNRVRDYAKNCSWNAGATLANDMGNHVLKGWERVLVAVDGEDICGYCTVAKTDCIPDVYYTPYIGYLFVGEEYRGNRYSQRLIQSAMNYLKSIGFDRVYLVSDHENLYEKYGFKVIERKIAPWGSEEKIYMRNLS